MNLPTRPPSAWFFVLLLAADAAIIAATASLPSSRSWGALGEDLTALVAGPPSPAPDVGDHAATDAGVQGDRGWAYCQTYLRWRPVTPISVALTYLEPELDADISATEIQRWLGDNLSPAIVDVYALAHKNGSRRVALELARAKWPRWQEVVGDAEGEAVCNLLRADLIARDIGRPRPPDGSGKASLHDFEFIYARRPKLYQSVTWLGTLEQVIEDGRLDELKAWLAGGAL
ncbi:MAG: hypothetical protein Tsb0020_25250 [Haliangiales bacterium]